MMVLAMVLVFCLAVVPSRYYLDQGHLRPMAVMPLSESLMELAKKFADSFAVALARQCKTRVRAFKTFAVRKAKRRPKIK
jgi:hypothetical protein